jgi:hypothetical protein
MGTKEVMKMSALVIGSCPSIGALRDVLIRGGFGAVYYQQTANGLERASLKGYGQLDMLILMKDSLEWSDIGQVLKKAVELDIPVFLW